METADIETDLSLFKYDNLEQLPEAYRDLDEAERRDRIEAAKAELGEDLVILGHNGSVLSDGRDGRSSPS